MSRPDHTPESLREDQIIRMLERAQNISRKIPVANLLMDYNPGNVSVQGVTQPLHLVKVPVTKVQACDFITRYLFIGSKISQVTLEISQLHYSSFGLMYDLMERDAYLNILRKDGYSIQFSEIGLFIVAMDNWIDANHYQDSFNQFCDELNKSPAPILYALHAIYSCLLGKKLTNVNADRWAKKCCQAMLGIIGGDLTSTNLTEIYPKYAFATDYHRNISNIVEFRAMAYLHIKTCYNNPMSSTWAKNILGGVLSRLSFTELTGFRLIYMYLIADKKFTWLWGWLACSAHEIFQAIERYLAYGEDAPFLKLITPSDKNPEFNTPTMKRVAEVARLVGLINGVDTLENVNTGFKFKDEVAAKTAIEAIIRAGDKATFKWSKFAQEFILPKEDNHNFYEIITHTTVSEDVNATAGETSVTN